MKAATVDARELEAKVKEMYRQVAKEPGCEYHFQLGAPVAERLGYPAAELERIPAGAVASFAGVGYHLALAALRPGEAVLDLGSGSGTDVFCAAALPAPPSTRARATRDTGIPVPGTWMKSIPTAWSGTGADRAPTIAWGAPR